MASGNGASSSGVGRRARGRRLGSRPRERGGLGEYRATAVAAIVVVSAMASVVGSINAGESSSPEIRGSDWSNEHPRMRQHASSMQAAEGRRPRSAVAADSAWSSSTPPLWLWRHLDALPRRLDAVDARLARIEALVELRLDQMAEGEKNRNAKDDLWRDQESRRIESSFDRLERRMAYMETRLAGAATAERVAAAAATPRLQEQLRCQQEKLEESVEGVRRALVEVVPAAVAAAVMEKLKMQEPCPTPTTSPPLHSQTLSHQSTQPFCLWAEDHVTNISKEAARTLRILKEKLTDEFGLQADNFVTKVGNMYNDLWQRAHTIESLLKDSLNLGNSTQRDMHEGFRTVVQQQQEQLQQLQQHNLLMQRERHGSHSPPLPSRRNGGASSHGHHIASNHGGNGRGDWSTGDALELGLGSLELSLDTLSGTVSRRLGDLGRRLDSSFRMLLLAQNLFLESCHRIQLGEQTLEGRLSHVLERLLDTVSNRSQGLDQEADEMKEALTLQTNQIIIVLEAFVNNTLSVIRESNEWLSSDIYGASQKITEEVSILTKKSAIDVVNGVSEAIKPEICSGSFSFTQEHSNGSFMNVTDNRDSIPDNSWKDISSGDSDTDFEFHNVAAVVKSAGPPNNHSVVAFFHPNHQLEDELSIDTTNETANLLVQVHQHPETASINDFIVEPVSNGLKELKEKQIKLTISEPIQKTEDLGTTIDPIEQEQLFEHEIQTTANTDSPITEDRVEHKRSTNNESDPSSVIPVDDLSTVETDGMSEKEHLQAIITALIDHFTSWDSKNNLDFSDINPINSSLEELKLILKYIISQVTNVKSDKDGILKVNETLEFSPQDVNLIHLAKAMIKMYEKQDLNLDMENLNINIPQISKLVKGEDTDSDNENKMEFSTDQILNQTDSNIDALYLRKISDLASKLYSKSAKSP